jgi:hypothetical protein
MTLALSVERRVVTADLAAELLLGGVAESDARDA